MISLRLLAAASLCTAPAVAQGPPGARSLTAKAVAESLIVLDHLAPDLKNDSTAAPAWYRTGMIAWALSDRARALPQMPGLDWTLLSRQADTSLRIAAQLAPKNPQYRLMVGRFLLMSGVSITRFASGGFFSDALDIARADSSAAVWHAEAAIEAGRIAWRRYDARANRRIELVPGAAIRSIAVAMQGMGSDATSGSPTLSLKSIQNALELNTMPVDREVSGQSDYQKAEELFREAYRINPTNPRAFRQLAMVMVEMNRWTDLRAFSRERLAKIPWDGWAWMALGLATHRQTDSRGAAAAFDSAMTYLDPADRSRIDRLQRVLRHTDTNVVDKGTEGERLARLRLYWMFADPLWSKDGNESRIEFLARVTHAELRWTVEEMYVHGVDSDRGDILVRYGPPDVVASFGGDAMAATGDVSIIWVYANGLMFTFTGAPTFATARIPIDDQAYVAELQDRQPVRWDNLSRFTIDSMATQVARFRAGDSVDLYLAAFTPADKIKAGSSTTSPPRADFWLLRGGIGVVFQDSTTLTGNGVRTWTRRVEPGNYVYRFEASAEGSNVTARATAPIVADVDPIRGFSTRGSGLSDLLLALKAEPKPRASSQRWTDLEISPSTGTVPLKSALTLVWENYGFGEAGGQANYQIAIVLQRDRSGAGRLAAKIIGNVSGAVGIDRSDDRMVIRFDRSMRHAPAIADFVAISLEDTPVGSYHLTLEITDKVTKRVYSRTTAFVIQK
jgi:GWxTD domain-containing protein